MRESLDRKEAYLKRLEFEIQSNLESTRKKSIVKQNEITEEIHNIPRDKSNIEATKADVTHFLKAYVNSFSGVDPLPKNENSFEEWRKEVNMLLKSKRYPELNINHAVRNSLKGQARKVFINMDPESTNQEIIDKMESVFGNVAS